MLSDQKSLKSFKFRMRHFFAPTGDNIARQAIELESCSNSQKMRKVL